MVKHILLILCILSSSFSLNSQEKFSVDTIVNKNETILVCISNYRGTLQWEQSFDLKTWKEIKNISDSLSIKSDRINFIRGKVQESSCYNNSYSDTLLINFDPKLLQLIPDTVSLGDTVILKGTDLNAWYKFLVRINNMETDAVYSSDTIIKVIIPFKLDEPISKVSITLYNTSDELKNRLVLRKPKISSVFPKTAKIGDTVYIAGKNFCIDPLYNYVYFGLQNQAKVILANKDSLKVIIPNGIYPNRLTPIVTCVAAQCDTLKSQLELTDPWLQRSNPPGGQYGRYFATYFSIGDSGYLGLGSGTSLYTDAKDFWKYDYTVDKWTKLNDFPGEPRENAISFVINNVAFVGGGLSNGLKMKDFWKYFPNSDTWERVSDIPVENNSGAATFSVGGKGYMVTVMNDSNFWVYDPQLNIWSKKNNFVPQNNNQYYPKLPDIGFVINNKGYVLTNDGTTEKDHLYEYDPVSDVFTRKADQIDELTYRDRIVFVINNEAYLFPDAYSEILAKYNPLTDTWVRLPKPKPTGRNGGEAFVFHNVGYIGGGMNFFTSTKDFWEFDPAYLK